MGKALFGAVCGAAVGGAILVALGMQGLDALWPALGVGVICGLIMRKVSHPSSGSYVNGGLAAMAVLAAVVGGKLALTAVLSSSQANSSQPAPTATSVVRPQVEDEPETDLEPGEEGEEPEVDAPAKPLPIPQVPASVSVPEIAPIDAVYLVVSALIAYQLGKGEGRKPEQDDQPSEEPSPEGSSEE